MKRTPEPYNNHHYSSKDDAYYEHDRRQMLEFVPINVRRVLDVGCSSGAFGQVLKARLPECEVWGVEPEKRVASIAADRIDRVISSQFTENVPELHGETFDCIVFNDVLEHLVDPNYALRLAKRHLRRDGSVVASIPNILHFYQIWEILVQQDWRYRREGILDETHLRFFTKKSILRMFEESGFEIEQLKGINPRVGKKYHLFNLLTFGRIHDWRFVQFGIRCRPTER